MEIRLSCNGTKLYELSFLCTSTGLGCYRIMFAFTKHLQTGALQEYDVLMGLLPLLTKGDYVYCVLHYT
jgi:hypothetical protein